jgi:hypothetical protein
MKKFLKLEIPKIGLLSHIMPQLKDYRLDEEREFYDIVPNRFKGNNRRSFLRINKETHYVSFLGSNLADKLFLLSSLDYRPLDDSYILKMFDIIYTAAEKYKIYDPRKNKSHQKNILNRLKNKNKLEFTSRFKTHFDVIGILSSKKKYRDLVMSRQYLFTDDCQLTEVYLFQLPIPYNDSNETIFNVMVTHLNGVWHINCEQIKKSIDGYIGVDYCLSDLDAFVLLIENEFSTQYKSVVKQNLDIDTDILNEDYITLLRMMNI